MIPEWADVCEGCGLLGRHKGERILTVEVRDMACKQCGKCCEHLGPGWFRLSDHPLIKAFTDILFCKGGDEFPDEGGCGMYDEETHECLIHKYLGFDAKPEVCREYPEDEPCMRLDPPPST